MRAGCFRTLCPRAALYGFPEEIRIFCFLLRYPFIAVKAAVNAVVREAAKTVMQKQL